MNQQIIKGLPYDKNKIEELSMTLNRYLVIFKAPNCVSSPLPEH